MTDRPFLRLVPPIESETGTDEIEASVHDAAPERKLVVENGQTLHRRYTVTVDLDGTEYVNDIEEWVE